MGTEKDTLTLGTGCVLYNLSQMVVNNRDDKNDKNDNKTNNHNPSTYHSLCWVSLPLLAWLWPSKKKEEENAEEEEASVEEVNPFVYTTPLSWWEILKIMCLSLTWVPFKLLLMLPFVVTAYTLSRLALLGLSPADLENPLSRWRSALLLPLPYLSRGLLFLMGYYWISTTGTRDSTAPIVVSNHVSYVDYFILAYLYNPSFVIDSEYADMPILGTILKAMQTLICSLNPESQKQLSDSLARRVQMRTAEKPIVVFPERVMTNGTHIVNFTPTAFAPGQPVQPVVLQYPHKHFCPSLPVAGPNFYFSFLRLLSQFYNSASVTYLPSYNPDASERQNASDFADSVRSFMLKISGLLDTGYSVEDARLLSSAMSLHIPASAINVEVQKLMEMDNLKYEDIEAMLKRFNEIDVNRDGELDIYEFAKFLGFERPTPYVERIFSLLDANNSGRIEFSEFLVGMSIISDGIDDDQLISLAFKSIDYNNDGSLEISEVANVLSAYSSQSSEEIQIIFNKIDTDRDGHVTLGEFSKFVKEHPEFNILQIARDAAAAKRAARKKLQADTTTKHHVGPHHNRRY